MISNGRLDAADLAYLPWPEASYLRLRTDAAASAGRLAVAFHRDQGAPLRITDAYRTYAQQVSLKITKRSFAATPGTSNHGLGIALDMASGINYDRSPQHLWMMANGPAFGWINPAWAIDYNAANGEHEPWHWEYHPELDDRGTVAAPASRPAPLTPEDDMFDTDDRAMLTDVMTRLRGPQFPAYDRIDVITSNVVKVLPLAQETRDRVRGQDPTGDVLQLLTAQVAALNAVVKSLAAAQGLDPAAIQATVETAVRNVLGSLA